MSSTQDQAVIQQKTTFVNDFVSNIFDKYGIIEPTIQEISTRYKQIITPLKFSIDNSIQSTRSIADTARIPILRMPAFILDVPEVERGLVLKPVPRKELTHTVVKFSGDTNAATAQPPAKKQKRSVGGSASSSVSSSSGRGGVSISSAESMYARSAGLRESAYAQPPIVAVPTSSLLPINLAQPITSSVSTSVPVPVSNEPIIDLKTVYPKMKSIVAYFWDLELPDRFVNGAFFGRIMANNYKDFGMEIFRPDFTNLLFIKDKMDENRYFTYREFLSDFDMMFQRIYDCFSTSHGVLTEARSLHDKFREMSAL